MEQQVRHYDFKRMLYIQWTAKVEGNGKTEVG